MRIECPPPLFLKSRAVNFWKLSWAKNGLCHHDISCFLCHYRKMLICWKTWISMFIGFQSHGTSNLSLATTSASDVSVFHWCILFDLHGKGTVSKEGVAYYKNLMEAQAADGGRGPVRERSGAPHWRQPAFMPSWAVACSGAWWRLFLSGQRTTEDEEALCCKWWRWLTVWYAAFFSILASAFSLTLAIIHYTVGNFVMHLCFWGKWIRERMVHRSLGVSPRASLFCGVVWPYHLVYQVRRLLFT
jgi:hypothetical protein